MWDGGEMGQTYIRHRKPKEVRYGSTVRARLPKDLEQVLHREVSWDLLQSRVGQERRVAIRVRDLWQRPPRDPRLRRPLGSDSFA